MTSTADPSTMTAAVLDGAQVREGLAALERELVQLRSSVIAGCGDRAPSGDGVPRLATLLDRQAANERFVEQSVAAVSAADGPASVARLDRSLLGSNSVPAPGSPGYPGLTSRRSIPWLDPGTGSWVVNAQRMWLGLPPSAAFRRRLLEEGPGALAAVAGSVVELGSANQARLAVTDPEAFAANWGRAGLAALGTLASYLELAPVLVTATVPGSDPLLAATTGSSPGQRLAASTVDLAIGFITDPDTVGESMIGWDQLVADPYQWAGALAPEIAIDLATSGAGRWLGAGRAANRGRRALIATPPARGELLIDDLAGASGTRGGRRSRPLEAQRRREPEWADAGPVRSNRVRPFEPPDGWVAEVNGEGIDVAGRRANCIDCSRAVESNWRGDDAVAAPLRSDRAAGTSLDRLEDWAGGRLVPTSLDGVERRLRELGPGSSAMVASTWDSGGAHAYNAINDRGTIIWVDGQLGEVGRWPPRYARSVDQTLALFIGPGGRPR